MRIALHVAIALLVAQCGGHVDAEPAPPPESTPVPQPASATFLGDDFHCGSDVCYTFGDIRIRYVAGDAQTELRITSLRYVLERRDASGNAQSVELDVVVTPLSSGLLTPHQVLEVTHAMSPVQQAVPCMYASYSFRLEITDSAGLATTVERPATPYRCPGP